MLASSTNCNNVKSYSFLPDIKKTRENSFILKNSVQCQREPQILEADFDKFNIFTRQQPANHAQGCASANATTQSVQLNAYKPTNHALSSSTIVNNNSSSINSNASGMQHRQSTSATPLIFKWDMKSMPKVKIQRASRKDLASNQRVLETPDERKKRMIFEQKLILEKRNYDLNLKHARSLEFLNHSTETMNQIADRDERVKEQQAKNVRATGPGATAAGDFGGSNSRARSSGRDKWSSNDYKDINLKKDIINKFYSIDNRRIRYHNPDKMPHFTKYGKNDSLERLNTDENFLGGAEAGGCSSSMSESSTKNSRHFVSTSAKL